MSKQLKKVEELMSRLMERSEEERVEWVNRVLDTIITYIKAIGEERNLLKKKRLAEEVARRLQEKQDEIIVAIMYAVKPVFRDKIVELLGVIGRLGV